MDRPLQIDVALISKITGLPTFGVQPEEYLDNKACKKEITQLVKAQFGTSWGNRGIVLKDINDNVTRFTNNIMACKLLRKFQKEEAPVGIIAMVMQCAKGVMFSWAPYVEPVFGRL
jgi:hypothetical protein